MRSAKHQQQEKVNPIRGQSISMVARDTSLISVIIPAYNHEKYIRDTVMSVICQDWPRMELLIVDDGSEDGTWALSQKLQVEALASDRFERVKIATQSNQGSCATINRLIKMSRGEIIALIASDDQYLPGAFSAMMKPMLEDEGIGLIVGRNELMDGNGKTCYWNRRRECVYNAEEAAYLTFNDWIEDATRILPDSEDFGTYGAFVRANHIANGYLIRKSALDKILPFRREAPLEDHWMHLQLSKITRYAAVDAHTFRYRWHDNNTCKQRAKMERMGLQVMRWERDHVRSIADSHWRSVFDSVIERRRQIFHIGRCLSIEKTKNLDEKAKFLRIFNWTFSLSRTTRISTEVQEGFTSRRLLAIVHVYYPEFWPELFRCLRNVGTNLDLYITYCSEDSVRRAREDCPSARFLKFDNIGYDVWPFVEALRSANLEDYDYVIKLHTKRNIDTPSQRPFNGQRVDGSRWRECLLSFVSTPQNWSRTLKMLCRPEVGMVADRRVICTRDSVLGRNTRQSFDSAVNELARAGDRAALLRGDFVAGTMFVAKVDALKPFLDCSLDRERFQRSSPRHEEGFAHICERMIGLSVAVAGKHIAAYNGDVRFWRAVYAAKRVLLAIPRFLLHSKVTTNRKLLIKMCQIPIWNSSVGVANANVVGRDTKLPF